MSAAGDTPAVTPREAAEAIFDMEDALNDTADRLALLLEALTPAGVTLPQAGLARMIGDMLSNMHDAIELWERAFHGTRELRRDPPPPSIRDQLAGRLGLPPDLDPLEELDNFTGFHAVVMRERREAAAIDLGFMLADA